MAADVQKKKFPWETVAPIVAGLVGGATPGLGRGVALGSNIWENMQQAKRMREITAMQKERQDTEQAAAGRMSEYLKGRAADYQREADSLRRPTETYTEVDYMAGGKRGRPLKREIFPMPDELDRADKATQKARVLTGAAMLAEAGQVSPIGEILRDIYKDEAALAAPFLEDFERAKIGEGTEISGTTPEGFKVKRTGRPPLATAAEALAGAGSMAAGTSQRIPVLGGGEVRVQGPPFESPTAKAKEQEKTKKEADEVARKNLEAKVKADEKFQKDKNEAIKQLGIIQDKLRMLQRDKKLMDPADYNEQLQALKEQKKHWEEIRDRKKTDTTQTVFSHAPSVRQPSASEYVDKLGIPRK